MHLLLITSCKSVKISCILENACTDTRTGGHGQADTDTDTYEKDGQLWKRRAVMEKTDTYGKDGHLWKRRTQSN